MNKQTIILLKPANIGSKFLNFLGDYKALRYAGGTMLESLKWAQKNVKKI